MLADRESVLRALRLPPESEVEVEPLGPSAERWVVCSPAGERMQVVLRTHPDGDLAANLVAVTETLSRTGFASMPRPLAALGDVIVEEDVPGVSALALVPPRGSLEAAIQASAELHGLDVREGLRWGSSPAELLSEEPPPLHRLGFAADERQAAADGMRAARDAILASPWGFVHGDATAANVVLGEGRAWLVNFHSAGFGPQFFDVAAFLLTAGLDAELRRELAGRYGELRGLPRDATADLVDLAGILWGIGELLVLPRRSIELLGDDASLAALNTGAGRIERGLREPAGHHPAAAAVRAALWPS